jgi:hypothetical protein
MAVKVATDGGVRKVGVAVIDTSRGWIGVCEFVDNDQLSTFESVVVQQGCVHHFTCCPRINLECVVATGGALLMLLLSLCSCRSAAACVQGRSAAFYSDSGTNVGGAIGSIIMTIIAAPPPPPAPPVYHHHHHYNHSPTTYAHHHHHHHRAKECLMAEAVDSPDGQKVAHIAERSRMLVSPRKKR